MKIKIKTDALRPNGRVVSFLAVFKLLVCVVAVGHLSASVGVTARALP